MSLNDKKQNSIFCIQAVLNQNDYFTSENFYNAIRNNILRAFSGKEIPKGSVICFPEYIGTWLVLLDEPNFILKSKTFKSALFKLSFRHFRRIIKHAFKSNKADKIAEALFRIKAEKILSIYFSTFSKIAKEFEVTIVGGSVVLPKSDLIDGKIELQIAAPLCNMSIVWNENGNAYHQIVKVSPTAPELKFMEGESLDKLRACETPAGKLGIIICGDAWEQRIYEALNNQGAEQFLTLAFVPSDVDWLGPWKGYSGKKEDADVNLNEIGKISEYEAWKKYCLFRASPYNKNSIVFYARTQLWNYGSWGHPMTLSTKKKSEFQVAQDGFANIEIKSIQ